MADRQFGAKREARRVVRRLVDLECAVFAEIWGEPIGHRVTDVSEEGLWIEADLLLEVGTDVALMFHPPDWNEPLYVAGRVQRVELETRLGDSSAIGMGIEFEALRSDERRRLTQSMRCLRAEEAFLLNQRTLIGVPVGAGNDAEPVPDPQRTVIGWAAPEAVSGQRPAASGQRSAASGQRPAAKPASSSAFLGGLDLATSVFASVRSD